uniref:Glucosylceramidase n=1 Tax=Panagrolaimus sp. PS1159 TaxID=55785 RepID=A0AC35F8T0_9BILA
CTGYLPFLGGVRLGDWSRGDQYIHSIIEDIQNFGSGWVDWNLCLDLKGGPNWVGNFVDAPIIISNTTDEYYKNPMFYALSHISTFVRPGSYRIQLTDSSSGEQPTTPIEGVAFTNSQSQRIVILNNRDDSEHDVTIEDAQRPGQMLTIKMEE